MYAGIRLVFSGIWDGWSGIQDQVRDGQLGSTGTDLGSIDTLCFTLVPIVYDIALGMDSAYRHPKAISLVWIASGTEVSFLRCMASSFVS